MNPPPTAETRAAAPLKPGLLVLHGNRLELLAEAVFDWLAQNPLGPLEAESVLVQSNGMAEWVKMELARAHGICAATRVELPARFIWRAYRAVLGRGAVPAVSALDKQPLTWRLMQLLPQCLGQPGFEPVAGFLRAGSGAQAGAAAANATGPSAAHAAAAAGDAPRRLQLAQRLADLFDQYQVYRSDWLADWAQGHDVLRRESAGATLALAAAAPVPPDQLWQPALWRAVLQGLPAAEQQGARAALHQRFLQALGRAEGGAAPAFPLLPRRIVLFGTTHIPHQTLEAVAALAPFCQVVMAVPNPCRYHWADLIEGRELLRAERQRHSPRGGKALANVALQDMHLHGHPLLAAWGRQGRDFVRQLDVFDDVQAARQRFAIPKVDLFESEPEHAGQPTLLEQVQAAVCNLLPLAEHPLAVQAARAQGAADERRDSATDDSHRLEAPTPAALALALPAAPTDRSIVFHVAHSAQREVEILHDQLLHLLATTPGLNPRDMVVMVPDVNRFAPAIRSVFGQHARTHARHIPWGITDQQVRGHQPVVVALEWLLRAPQQRFGASELRDLLDVPAVAQRFGVREGDLPTVLAWVEGAGIRWGLHAAQRHSLGLGAAGEQNTWAFGLKRMLLGYAAGADAGAAGGFQGSEPYTEVAGLEAALAGTLAELLHALDAWWCQSQSPGTPSAWAERLRGLLAQFFKATDDAERALLATLDEALGTWLQACEAAAFDEPVELAVVREAWLEGLEAPGLNQRFKAGGITFCTLLPLRAIPFKVVCLLGMNEADYPRRSARSDFDLMAQPGQARPGDRSRRDDDRQLMLDALLSARQVLYVSWVGRSVRDNSPQPPSVLVSQLQDYLKAGWGPQVLAPCTTEHPLQAFSRRYFETGSALFTYAREWRAGHEELTPEVEGHGEPSAPLPADTGPRPVTLAELAQFLRNPVRHFFQHRLQVRFDEGGPATADEEPFEADHLEQWQQVAGLLQAVQTAQAEQAEQARQRSGAPQPATRALLQRELARLQRSGQLPLAGPGQREVERLLRRLAPALAHWEQRLAEWPLPAAGLALRWSGPAIEQTPWHLEDQLDGLRQGPTHDPTTDLGAGPGNALSNELANDLLAVPANSPCCWFELQASKLLIQPKSKDKPPEVRADKLLLPWLRALATAACGQPLEGLVIGPDGAVHVRPPPQDEAQAQLAVLLRALQHSASAAQPWPTAIKSGLAHLADPERAAAVFEGDRFGRVSGEGREACLARLFPDFASLWDAGFAAATEQLYSGLHAGLAEHVTVAQVFEPDPEEAAWAAEAEARHDGENGENRDD